MKIADQYDVFYFRLYLIENNITEKDIARELRVKQREVEKLIDGLYNEDLLIEFCKVYNLDFDDFFVNRNCPGLQTDLRLHLNDLLSETQSIEEVAKIVGLDLDTTRKILLDKKFILDRDKALEAFNIAKEFLLKIYPPENKPEPEAYLKDILGDNSYVKLLADAEKHFSGDIREALKFLVDKHYYYYK